MKKTILFRVGIVLVAVIAPQLVAAVGAGPTWRRPWWWRWRRIPRRRRWRRISWRRGCVLRRWRFQRRSPLWVCRRTRIRRLSWADFYGGRGYYGGYHGGYGWGGRGYGWGRGYWGGGYGYGLGGWGVGFGWPSWGWGYGYPYGYYYSPGYYGSGPYYSYPPYGPSGDPSGSIRIKATGTTILHRERSQRTAAA